ncbi:MAG: tetraacyldisaccharide 4'-kinase [Gemmatimonadetes bacterium]|nr:tetraacyldisaccharide 4'-kinase [Gemmatimonadota bacterium]MXX71946.1 tetraacyldisaccharide 4'-kinase [Gemmatimonadota bacterium]MYC91797.1 tetraacyldisaccharide 4'-kinase [Gemmatimonadota bacterium]MYG37370.1 tetraacyldisaccharide 4'-kinase [Gemmatimonadota bacterium]MYJ17654.1 tetraacyldisaccharide 4'-kinase [Gemmatimonadota bacterium]
MTEWARRTVRDFWAAEPPGLAARLTGALLTPAELSFRATVAMRNAWYDNRRSPSTPVPVVSVGNLTVGGTGKTPVVRWLAEWLQRTGARPAIVTRGYGRDELALYRRWFGEHAVLGNRDRRACVRAAADRGYTVVVLDDGFQQRRLARVLDILLVAVEDPIRPRMLPRGPYREPPASARRAAAILLTLRTPQRRRAAAWRERLSKAAPGVPLLDLEIRMGGWTDLGGAPAAPPQGDVLAVCAIARPGPFFSGLGALLPDAHIEHRAYADHHDYTFRDVSALLRRLGQRAVVCTAKDAVKLAAFPELAGRCVVAGFDVVGDPAEPLRRALAEVVEQ